MKEVSAAQREILQLLAEKWTLHRFKMPPWTAFMFGPRNRGHTNVRNTTVLAMQKAGHIAVVEQNWRSETFALTRKGRAALKSIHGQRSGHDSGGD